MATLLVRRLDEDLICRLKARASAHGRSVEAEHRAILKEALRPTGRQLWNKLAQGEKGHLDTDSNARQKVESADFG
jgi:plasmid stability protein